MFIRSLPSMFDKVWICSIAGSLQWPSQTWLYRYIAVSPYIHIHICIYISFSTLVETIFSHSSVRVESSKPVLSLMSRGTLVMEMNACGSESYENNNNNSNNNNNNNNNTSVSLKWMLCHCLILVQSLVGLSSILHLVLRCFPFIIQSFFVYFETRSFFSRYSSCSIKRKENTFLCKTFEFILLNRCGLIFFTVVHLWHFIRSPGHFICTLHFGT